MVYESPKDDQDDQDLDASTMIVTENLDRLGNGKGNSVYHLLEDNTEAEMAEMAEKGQTFYGTSTEARYIQATRDQGMVDQAAPKNDPEKGRDSSNGGNENVVEGQAMQSNDGLFGPNGLLSSWTIWFMLVLVALVQVKQAWEQPSPPPPQPVEFFLVLDILSLFAFHPSLLNAA